ncbi:MAG: prephenate dehydrogenase/arogenate dehydrogenase family protein [Bdellovibrionales bacterium]|nr:prephenate dehydrogenase/arogenate dehydrogenase family protein [Bdellovibrionales bacterium]
MNTTVNSRITLFGFGRFGKLLYDLLSQEKEVVVHDPEIPSEDFRAVRFVSLEEALKSPVLIYAVPIPAFSAALQQHCEILREHSDDKLFIDVLSVKVLPKELFLKFVPSQHQLLLTHPMFGPDSVREAGLEGQRMVVSPLRMPNSSFEEWRSLFERIGLSVIEMSAEEHDRIAARSQGLTHFIGRVLDAFGMDETSIDTLGARQLLAIKEQTCNDSWELFSGLQTQNPYTVDMRTDLGKALDQIYGKLLPKQRDPEILTVGIQGGKGSFNEEAARYYLERAQVKSFQLEYLFTTENVLRALHRGEVDCGQFAVHNSIGGVVAESMTAMANYRFAIEEEFSILISHTLMKRRDVSLADITTIMTHPQVIKQCKKNLAAKYSRLKLTSGEGSLIDSANAARALAKGELPKDYAVMGSKVIAEIYDLDIVEGDMQDLQENLTSFFWVTRVQV